MKARLRRILSLALALGLLLQQTSFAQVAVELNIADHLAIMGNRLVSEKFRPLHLRYFSYDLNSDNFRLLVDKGDLKNLRTNELTNASKELLNYFLVGVTLPDEAFWVNLRPDSENQIIDPWLEQTDVGKIMLEADLQLKKDTALFTSPQTPEGREYWRRLYQKAEELYGLALVSIPTLTRPWIVPGEIIVRESNDSAYVYKAVLKVMLEQDYLKSQQSIVGSPQSYEFKDARAKALNEYSTQLIRELIIPRLTKEVNSSKRYAALRQVYYSLILSRWFKHKFADKKKQPPTVAVSSYIGLINTRNLTNLTSKTPWSKTAYFKQYQKSFSEGEYNIKEPVYTPTGQVIRSYFSGGVVINPQNPGDYYTLRNAAVPRGSDTVMFEGKGDNILPRTMHQAPSTEKSAASPLKVKSVMYWPIQGLYNILSGLEFSDWEHAPKATTEGRFEEVARSYNARHRWVLVRSFNRIEQATEVELRDYRGDLMFGLVYEGNAVDDIDGETIIQSLIEEIQKQIALKSKPAGSPITISGKELIDKLGRLQELLPNESPQIWEFGKFLITRMDPHAKSILAEDFVLITRLALHDLQTGMDGTTVPPTPLRHKLVGYNKATYDLWVSWWIPIVAWAVGGEAFAKEVEEFSKVAASRQSTAASPIQSSPAVQEQDFVSLPVADETGFFDDFSEKLLGIVDNLLADKLFLRIRSRIDKGNLTTLLNSKDKEHFKLERLRSDLKNLLEDKGKNEREKVVEAVEILSNAISMMGKVVVNSKDHIQEGITEVPNFIQKLNSIWSRVEEIEKEYLAGLEKAETIISTGRLIAASPIMVEKVGEKGLKVTLPDSTIVEGKDAEGFVNSWNDDKAGVVEKTGVMAQLESLKIQFYFLDGSRLGKIELDHSGKFTSSESEIQTTITEVLLEASRKDSSKAPATPTSTAETPASSALKNTWAGQERGISLSPVGTLVYITLPPIYDRVTGGSLSHVEVQINNILGEKVVSSLRESSGAGALKIEIGPRATLQTLIGSILSVLPEEVKEGWRAEIKKVDERLLEFPQNLASLTMLESKELLAELQQRISQWLKRQYPSIDIEELSKSADNILSLSRTQELGWNWAAKLWEEYSRRYPQVTQRYSGIPFKALLVYLLSSDNPTWHNGARWIAYEYLYKGHRFVFEELFYEVSNEVLYTYAWDRDSGGVDAMRSKFIGYAEKILEGQVGAASPMMLDDNMGPAAAAKVMAIYLEALDFGHRHYFQGIMPEAFTSYYLEPLMYSFYFIFGRYATYGEVKEFYKLAEQDIRAHQSAKEGLDKEDGYRIADELINKKINEIPARVEREMTHGSTYKQAVKRWLDLLNAARTNEGFSNRHMIAALKILSEIALIPYPNEYTLAPLLPLIKAENQKRSVLDNETRRTAFNLPEEAQYFTTDEIRAIYKDYVYEKLYDSSRQQSMLTVDEKERKEISDILKKVIQDLSPDASVASALQETPPSAGSPVKSSRWQQTNPFRTRPFERITMRRILQSLLNDPQTQELEVEVNTLGIVVRYTAKNLEGKEVSYEPTLHTQFRESWKEGIGNLDYLVRSQKGFKVSVSIKDTSRNMVITATRISVASPLNEVEKARHQFFVDNGLDLVFGGDGEGVERSITIGIETETPGQEPLDYYGLALSRDENEDYNLVLTEEPTDGPISKLQQVNLGPNFRSKQVSGASNFIANLKQGHNYLTLTHLENALREATGRDISFSSSPATAGGIDFTTLPVAIQPMGSFSGLNFSLPRLSRAELEGINIDSEIEQVMRLASSGIMPSDDRMKRLIAACAQKGQLGQRADNLLLCLIDICKLQEEGACESSAEFREALVIVDSQA